MNDIQNKVDQLNNLFLEIREYKDQHPEEKTGYYLSIESLLNAYREGDINFNDCVSKIKEVKE